MGKLFKTRFTLYLSGPAHVLYRLRTLSVIQMHVNVLNCCSS